MSNSPPIIAREELIGQRADGERFPIVIEIGPPFRWGEDASTEYCCDIAIAPWMKRRGTHGNGSLQALCLALQVVRSELNHFMEEGGLLFYDTGEPFDLEPFWPLQPY